MRAMISFLLLTNLCFAEAIYLPKNEVAPFEGYLISPDKVKSLYKESQELDKYKQIYKIDQTIIEKQSKSIDNLSSEYLKLQKKYKYEKYIYLISGILITGLTVKLVK